MSRRIVLSALTCALTLLPLGQAALADASADLGGPNFSLRVATEVAQRRAQVAHMLACRQVAAQTGAPAAEAAANRLPLSPPVGTGGPVQPASPYTCPR